MDQYMQNQPTVNIGMLGSVSNGKTTITRAITGVSTQKHSSEIKKNLTIRLGYANAKIYKCSKCPRPICYQPFSSNKYNVKCKKCGSDEMTLIKHVSFVDCPGHNMLMSTMLNGTCVMDGAILVESANNEIPRPQTFEHLIAAEVMDLENFILCINKMDLIEKDKVREQYDAMKKFTKGCAAENSPIVPVSANFGINCDVICEYICTKIPQPMRDLECDPKMIIVRSFNVNKQGTKINDIIGGVIGGSLVKGKIRIGQIIEIKPGYFKKFQINNEVVFKTRPIRSKVISINSEKNQLEEAVPGGLIGIGLTIDPALTKNNNMIGSVVGLEGTLPEVYQELSIKYKLLQRTFDDNSIEIQSVKKDETIAINVNASTIQCKVLSTKKRTMTVRTLNKPICLAKDDKISITRNINKGWRLVGIGEFVDGKPIETF